MKDKETDILEKIRILYKDFKSSINNIHHKKLILEKKIERRKTKEELNLIRKNIK